MSSNWLAEDVASERRWMCEIEPPNTQHVEDKIGLVIAVAWSRFEENTGRIECLVHIYRERWIYLHDSEKLTRGTQGGSIIESVAVGSLYNHCITLAEENNLQDGNDRSNVQVDVTSDVTDISQNGKHRMPQTSVNNLRDPWILNLLDCDSCETWP